MINIIIIIVIQFNMINFIIIYFTFIIDLIGWIWFLMI